MPASSVASVSDFDTNAPCVLGLLGFRAADQDRTYDRKHQLARRRRHTLGVAGIAKKIMIGYDGSDVARRALERAVELGGAGSTLIVVHVSLPLYRHTFSAMPDVEAVERGKQLLGDAQTYLAEQSVQVRTLEQVGEPADALIEAAKGESADLLVVGRRDRHGLGHFALGSVSSKVVRDADCDVLVVR
jgi:nucleotide-binding universal stress UspA family protein